MLEIKSTVHARPREKKEVVHLHIENKKILQDLQRLGLKDIYLDKSFRNDDGSTSSEMNRLINDLLNTNQNRLSISDYILWSIWSEYSIH